MTDELGRDRPEIEQQGVREPQPLERGPERPGERKVGDRVPGEGGTSRPDRRETPEAEEAREAREPGEPGEPGEPQERRRTNVDTTAASERSGFLGRARSAWDRLRHRV